MSRPSKFTEALANAICGDIMDGMSLRAICEKKTMPDRSTVLRWQAADEEFAAKCARARVLQADALEEEMSDIEDKTLSGELDPAAARVVLSSKQWRAAKMAPKRYGDRLAVGGADDMPAIKTETNVTMDAAEAYKLMLGIK